MHAKKARTFLKNKSHKGSSVKTDIKIERDKLLIRVVLNRQFSVTEKRLKHRLQYSHFPLDNKASQMKKFELFNKWF